MRTVYCFDTPFHVADSLQIRVILPADQYAVMPFMRFIRSIPAGPMADASQNVGQLEYASSELNTVRMSMEKSFFQL